MTMHSIEKIKEIQEELKIMRRLGRRYWKKKPAGAIRARLNKVYKDAGWALSELNRKSVYEYQLRHYVDCDVEVKARSKKEADAIIEAYNEGKYYGAKINIVNSWDRQPTGYLGEERFRRVVFSNNPQFRQEVLDLVCDGRGYEALKEDWEYCNKEFNSKEPEEQS